MRRVTVRSFKGKTLCDVREFYMKDEKPAPGKKGIALTEEQWSVLRQDAPSISAALAAQDATFHVSLGSERRVQVREFKHRYGVDCREMYTKEGATLPGKKGIYLTPEQWEGLACAADDIDAAMMAAGGGGSARKPRSEGPRTPADAHARTTGANQSQHAAPGSAAEADGGRAGGLPVKLSAMRQADVSAYKGKVYVNVREFYESNGELKPGSKGLALTPEQFNSVRQAEPAISAALAAGDTSYEMPLSERRKLSVSLFSNKHLVNLREYYEKEGKELPGKKGISLPAEQWQALVQGFSALGDALDAHGA
ncbi:hypothetical protein WJX81_000817 [Elliptochloris bilobata]|uniref:Transcriptional coactivator p15 (PC4) C-terminal domain-containing protein n=1 Tax=Elliptochloris bilobata TaxID=381761 RepID=A0AAW1QZM9_9CHLO